MLFLEINIQTIMQTMALQTEFSVQFLHKFSQLIFVII